MNQIKDILSKYKTIAMIGVSNDQTKPSTIVMKYMQKYGYKVFPVNPSAKGQKILGEEVILPPPDTALGALAHHLITENNDFQPMNANFGLFKSTVKNLRGKKNRQERYLAYTSIAKSSFLSWLESQRIP